MKKMDSKGVSETVGYLLILGVVIVSISYAYMHTHSMIEDTSSKFKAEGLRQSFKRIQNVLASSTYGGAPLQSIQVELHGSFWIANETYLRVVKNSIPVFEGYVKSLNYKYEDIEIVLENGAVWENNHGYKRAVEYPRIFVHKSYKPSPSGDTETIVVVVVNRYVQDFSISGEGSIRLTFNTTSTSFQVYDGPGNVTITVESPYAELWYDFFETLPGNSEFSGNTANFTTYYDKLVLSEYDIVIESG